MRLDTTRSAAYYLDQFCTCLSLGVSLTAIVVASLCLIPARLLLKNDKNVDKY